MQTQTTSDSFSPSSTPSSSPGRLARYITLAFLLTILGAMIMLRIFYLPGKVLSFVNHKLENIPGYHGHANDVTLSLWRAAYQIHGVNMEKAGTKAGYFSAETISLSLEWKALLHGLFGARVEFFNPKLNLEKTLPGETTANSGTGSLQALKELFPIDINRFDVANGEVSYKDTLNNTATELSWSHITATGDNLLRSSSSDRPLPADIDVTASFMGSGPFNLQLALNPKSDHPAFELKESLLDMDLSKLNDLLYSYAKVKFKQGSLTLSNEITAKDGSFKGYNKAVFKDVLTEKGMGGDRSSLEKLVADSGSGISWSQNTPRDPGAAKKVFEGKFLPSQNDVWVSAGNLIRDAFYDALVPVLESGGRPALTAKGGKVRTKKEELKEAKDKENDKKKGLLKNWKEKREVKKEEKRKRREEKKKEKTSP